MAITISKFQSKDFLPAFKAALWSTESLSVSAKTNLRVLKYNVISYSNSKYVLELNRQSLNKSSRHVVS